MLNSALAYAERGLHVFPCKEKGKRPLTSNGFKAATTNREQIELWWAARPDANIAIATGTISGIVVLDIDGKNNGDESMKALEAIHGGLPNTPEVLTGGGRHVWFAHPGYTVHTNAGTLGEGLDLRGDGGYVIVPPSIHENGRTYEWEVVHDLETPLAPLPAWLVTYHTTKRIAPDEPIKEGSRNTTLFRMACAMHKQGMNASAIHEALSITNKKQCQPPVPELDIKRIVGSATRYQGRSASQPNKKVGILWEYATSTNTPYFSGYIDLGIGGQVKVVVFRNDYKEGNQPDYNIFISNPKEDNGDQEETSNE
jgi:hypothetical protein